MSGIYKSAPSRQITLMVSPSIIERESRHDAPLTTYDRWKMYRKSAQYDPNLASQQWKFTRQRSLQAMPLFRNAAVMEEY
jgi:hypothetical protein